MRATAILVVLSLLVASTWAASFTFSPNPNTASFVYGQSQTFYIVADPTYPNVSLEIQNTIVNIVPSIFNFTEGALNHSFTVTAGTTQSGYNPLTFLIDGEYGIYYTTPNVYVTIAPRTLSFTGGYSSSYPGTAPVVGTSTSSFLLSLTPYPLTDVTAHVATDPAGAADFSQASFSFTSAITTFPFTFTPKTADPFVAYWTFTGTDASLYAPKNNTITAQKRAFVFSTLPTPPKVGATSALISVSVNYLPPSPITLTPNSDDGKITFTPASITFDSDTGLQQFAYSASAAGAHNVYWTVSGVESSWYNGVPANSTITIPAREFEVTTPNTASYTAGQVSEPWVIFTQVPPDNDVSILLTVDANCPQPGTGVVLSTNTLTYSPTVLSQSFTVASDYQCNNVVVTAVTSGTDKDLYYVNSLGSSISFGKISVNVVSLDASSITSVLYCGETRNARIYLSGPPPNGFSVSISAPGGSFSQSSFDFTPTTISYDFTVTASYLISTIQINYVVSGADSALVNNVASTYISSSGKTITPVDGPNFVTPGEGSLFVGTQSSPQKVTLSRAPTSDLTLSIHANGVTFAPTSLQFTNKDTVQLLSVSGATAGTYDVTYSISGTDSACYTINYPVTTQVEVELLSISVVPGIQTVTVGIKSNVYTISIDNLPADQAVTVTPSVLDTNGNPVAAGIYTFTPATFTLSSLTPSTTFTYVVSAVRPSGDQFVFSTDQPALVAGYTLFSGVVNRRSFTTPQYLKTSATGNVRAAYVIIGVESLPYVVTLPDGAPPTAVSLRPTAPNTVFNPPVLNFDADTTAVSFTITTNQGAGASGTNNGIITTVTWIVEGTDATLYNTPANNAFFANLRTISVAVGDLTYSQVPVNQAIPFTITTPYPPETQISFAPYSTGFSFSPLQIGLGTGTTSASFTATPTQTGSQTIQWGVFGEDADKYIALDAVSFTVEQGYFIINYPSFPSNNPVYLTYGGEPYVFKIRATAAPQTSVTLSFYSQQVEFDPPSFTFTPTALETSVSVLPVYSPFAPAGTYLGVAIQYVLSGPDALNFAAPGAGSFNAEITDPLREISVTGDVYIFPGRNASFSVSSNLPPLSSVTITPSVVADSDYWFSPASATFTPTSSATTFTVGRNSANIPVDTTFPIILTVSGPDAYLYAAAPSPYIHVQTGGISLGNMYDNAQFYWQSKNIFSVSLNYAPVAGDLTVTPYVITGQPIVFTPASLTFTAPTVSQTVSFQTSGVGNSRIGFKVGGPAALEYAYLDDVDISSIKGTPSLYIPDSSVNTGGATSSGQSYFYLPVPAVNGLDVYLSAPGFTFEPEVLHYAAGENIQYFTFTATASSLNTYIITSYGGLDAPYYNNPCATAYQCPVSSGAGIVTANVGNADTLKTTVAFGLNYAVPAPLTVVPAATPSAGVTFVPPTVTFTPNSGTSQTITVYTTSPGPVSFSYSLTGDAAPFYRPSSATPYVLTFLQLELQNDGNIDIYPGRNASFVVTSNIPPPTSVFVTPTVSEPGYWFSPVDAELTPDVSSLTFTVGRTSNDAPAVSTVKVNLVVSGTDAALYSDASSFNLNVESATINIDINNGDAFTIGQAQTVRVTLAYPPIGGDVTVTPSVVSGQDIDFEPASLTFTAPSVSQTFTLKPTARGTSVIGFALSGTAAAQYEAVTSVEVINYPADINIDIDDWNPATGGVSITKNTVTLSAAVSEGLSVHFSAPGFTFDPAVVSFGPGDITQSFSFTADANNLETILITELSGPDAANYNNPCSTGAFCQITSGAGQVSVSVGAASALRTTITFSLNAPTTLPLTITPSTVPFAPSKRAINADANGVTFVPSSITFADATTTSQTIKVFATVPGQYNLYYQLSGAAKDFYAPQWNDQVANPTLLTFNQPSVTVTYPAAVPAGSHSLPVTVTPNGAAPGVTLPSVTITPSANPAGAVEFIPPSVTINTSTPVSFAYKSSSVGTFLVSYALSGPGASTYAPIATQTLTINPASFSIPALENLYMYPNPTGGIFVYGVPTQYFTVYARAVANNVTLQLYSDSVTFTPSELYFGTDVHSASFSFTPKKVGPITIAYGVSGYDAANWNIPAPTNLRATYKVGFAAIPTQTVGTASDPIAVTIEPAPVDSFVLSLVQNNLVFSPAKLVFTPQETTKFFTVVPTVTTLPRPSISMPGYSVSATGVNQLTIGLQGHDAAETADYTIPTGNPVAVVVGPGWFSVQHPRYQLDVESKITIEISSLPRADVTVSLFSNNLHLTPPYITFTAGGAKSQEVTVVPRQTTSYELDYASFKVDYVLSGTNAGDYIAPSESLHYFAIPRGYIAAIVLVPIAVVVLAIVAYVVLGVLRNKSS